MQTNLRSNTKNNENYYSSFSIITCKSIDFFVRKDKEGKCMQVPRVLHRFRKFAVSRPVTAVTDLTAAAR
jgi:hypothetical protein